MSKIYDLKIKSLYFDAVVNGDKTFEIRKDDKDYQVGDLVKMREISLPSGSLHGPGSDSQDQLYLGFHAEG